MLLVVKPALISQREDWSDYFPAHFLASASVDSDVMEVRGGRREETVVKSFCSGIEGERWKK